MTTGLGDIPSEITNCVTEYLDIRDYLHLAQASRRFGSDLKADGSARRCLQKQLQCAQDGQRSFSKARKRGFRKRLSEVFRTKEALRTASPYSITTLAYATSFVYEQGVLVYSTSNSIRLLDVHSAKATEKVISMRFFSHKVASPGESASSATLQPRSVTLLSYRESIFTVVCDFGPSKGCYLFAVTVADSNTGQRCLLKSALRSTDQFFAVHNKDYLYCGSLSARGSHSHHEWLLQGFDLATGNKLTDEPVQLHNFAGSDLGNSVAFTIHGEYFIALSNQTSHESEEVNWTSYYHHISFRLNDKDPSRKIKAIYRRQDGDGPINDTWTNLGFQIDHETGDLLVVECRKEWLGGGSTAVRTYYSQPWERADHHDWDGQNTVNPSDPVRRTVTEKDQARYETSPHPRVDKYTHTEFEAGSLEARQEYLRAKTKWHGYDFNNQCYVDLVVDEVEEEGSWRKKERIRLRVVSRLPDSPIVKTRDSNQSTGQSLYEIRPRTLDRNNDEVMDSEDAFKESETYLWPRDGTDIPKELVDMMCPGGKAGEVKAQTGEEGIIYIAGPRGQFGGGGEGNERALIFIGFEPGWGFEGMKRLDGKSARPRKTVSVDIQPGLCHLKRKAELAEPSVATKKQKKDDCEAPDSQQTTPSTASESKSNMRAVSSTSVPAIRERLLWMEKAKYLSINKGYWLR